MAQVSILPGCPSICKGKVNRLACLLLGSHFSALTVLVSPTSQTRCAQFICICLECIIDEILSSSDTKLLPIMKPISLDSRQFVTGLITSLPLHFSYPLIKARLGLGKTTINTFFSTELSATKITTDATTSSSTNSLKSRSSRLSSRSNLTKYPSSNKALHETSPLRPDPNPNPLLSAQPLASPAQLEAFYAAASSGDLPLLQRLGESTTDMLL